MGNNQSNHFPHIPGKITCYGTRLSTVNHRPFLSDFFLRGGAVCTQATNSSSSINATSGFRFSVNAMFSNLAPTSIGICFSFIKQCWILFCPYINIYIQQCCRWDPTLFSSVLNVLLWSKNHFLVFFRFWKCDCLTFDWLNFIQRLFTLSVSFGFHGPSLLTFKTDQTLLDPALSKI